MWGSRLPPHLLCKRATNHSRHFKTANGSSGLLSANEKHPEFLCLSVAWCAFHFQLGYGDVRKLQSFVFLALLKNKIIDSINLVMLSLTQILDIIRYTFNQQNKLWPAERRYSSLDSARMLSFTLSTTTHSLCGKWVKQMDRLKNTAFYFFFFFYKHCIVFTYIVLDLSNMTYRFYLFYFAIKIF